MSAQKSARREEERLLDGPHSRFFASLRMTIRSFVILRFAQNLLRTSHGESPDFLYKANSPVLEGRNNLSRKCEQLVDYVLLKSVDVW